MATSSARAAGQPSLLSPRKAKRQMSQQRSDHVESDTAPASAPRQTLPRRNAHTPFGHLYSYQEPSTPKVPTTANRPPPEHADPLAVSGKAQDQNGPGHGADANDAIHPQPTADSANTPTTAAQGVGPSRDGLHETSSSEYGTSTIRLDNRASPYAHLYRFEHPEQSASTTQNGKPETSESPPPRPQQQRRGAA